MAFLALSDKFLEGRKDILDYEKYRKDNALDNLTAAFDIAGIVFNVHILTF
jgi:hypothetical protein